LLQTLPQSVGLAHAFLIGEPRSTRLGFAKNRKGGVPLSVRVAQPAPVVDPSPAVILREVAGSTRAEATLRSMPRD